MASSIPKKRKFGTRVNGTYSSLNALHSDPSALAAERMFQLDAQADALKAEQDRIHNELLDVLRQRNGFTPVNRLPVELLSTIFEWIISIQGCASRYLDRAPLNVSQVCTHWRAVALATPELWADIRIGYGARSNRGIHLDTLYQKKMELSRTGSVPLHVTYKHYESHQNHAAVEEIVQMLRKEAYRIRSLQTIDQVINNNLLDSLPPHMPQLESLMIAQANTHEIFNLVPFEQIPLPLLAHALKVIRLQHVALQIYDDSTCLQGLRELYLSHSLIQFRRVYEDLPGPGDFTPQEEPLSLDILRLAPNLEVLSIKQVYVSDSTTSELLIPLHKLRKLILLVMEDPPEMGTFRVPMIFNQLDVPKLQDLELWGQPLEQVSPHGLFVKLATEHPHLQRLAFRHAVIPGKPFLTLLSQLKNLRVLDCLNTTTIRPILKALRRQDASGAFIYAPKLEELHLRALQDHLQVPWVSKHLQKTLRTRRIARAELKRLFIYPLPDSVLRSLRAFVPYIVTNGGSDVSVERQDALERCGEMEELDYAYNFGSDRVYYDRYNGVNIGDHELEPVRGGLVADMDSDSSDTSDDLDVDNFGLLEDNFHDFDDDMGVDAMLNTSDIEEEEEGDWSTEGDGLTDADSMTEPDGATEGDASFIGSDPVTDIDFGLM